MKAGDSSFRGLFGDGHRVEIPVIQRDYAQGREDEHSQEVRRRFVDALNEALSVDRTNGAPLDLDFVYGRWKAKEFTFEPLDGQQRLTTLFLLHWYLASVDGEFDEFRSWIALTDGSSSFTYRTRPAAREFFDALIREPASPRGLVVQPHALSAAVTDSIWFVQGWRRDPTVRGCLKMLDAIHERFAGSKGSWQRLVSTKAPAIVFRVLPLENFGLSDDLYIKMNARGKALTRFEIFKAEFGRFVGKSFDRPCVHEPARTWPHYVSRRFDTVWTDFFWKHRGATSEIDSSFMHLIRALALVHCVDRTDDARLPEQVEHLLTNPQPALHAYEELGCLDGEFVEELVGGLDTLAGHKETPTFLRRVDYLNEAGVFRRILLARRANQEDGLTLVDWVMFYGWFSFLRRFAKDLRSEPTRALLHDWIRVVANLAGNSNIDRNDRLVAALRGLKQFAHSCGSDFLTQVANGAFEKISGFNQQQQQEERLKAQLILRSADWRPLIERAETHPYFRGDIEFLLRFSGVFDRAAQTGCCDWSDDEDNALRQSFADWHDRACAVFPANATVGLAPFPEFLWERALLATGDYLLPRGANWSFLDDKDRDASWKRLLRADTRVPDREARRDVVRRVLAQIDPKDTIGSLRAIIAAGMKGDDAAPVPGLRRRLVDEPRLIEYCGLRMLRLEEESAFLLRGMRRSGKHVDLYVYDLYLGLHGRLAKLAPFDKIELIEVSVIHPPSRIDIRATLLGLSVTAEKRGAAMQLHLQLPEPNTQIASLLTDWTVDSQLRLSRSVLPDAAEGAVSDLAALVRTLFPETGAPTDNDAS